MKPSEKVKRQVEDLYLQTSKMQHGEICIYPDLARHLNAIKIEVAKLVDESLTMDPSQIIS